MLIPKYKCLVLISLLSIFLFPDIAKSNTEENFAQQLISRANEKNLAQSKQWLRLLHYNQGGTLHSRNRSYIRSPQFFLSPNGAHNAQQELEETLRQFFETNIQQRCSFPARFHWLSEQLELEHYSHGLKNCTEFLNVQSQVAAKKMTLIFPSAYLNSASSVFGHTLLRIDNGADDEAVILNWAINYGAKLNDKDGAVKYAMKGIAGLYDGQYFIVPYSQKIKEYGQMENRDIWEYPLTLSEAEVTFLTEHLWELKDINFDYFFFDENCSYRLLELLEVAKPELDLTSQFRFTEIPINTVKTLMENNLIDSSVFRASKERLLNHRFEGLNTEEKKLAKRISDDLTIANENIFQNLTLERQLAVLQSAYDYLRFQQSSAERDEKIAKRSLKLLQQINQISIQENETNKHSEKQTSATLKPIKHDGDILKTHDSQRLGITSGKLIDGKPYQSIQYRMAYHELLDNSEGFFKGAHIEGPALTVKKNDVSTYIDNITLLNIISLNPRSDIRQDFSWALGIKAERSDEANAHLQTSIFGGGGFAWQTNNFLAYQLLLPRLAFNPEFEKEASLGLEFKFGLIHNSGKHPALLEFKSLKLDEEAIKYFANFSQQIELNRNHALRLKLKYFEKNPDGANEIEEKSIELSYFFYF